MDNRAEPSDLPAAFCVLPWTQIATTVKGFTRLCCFAKNLRDQQGRRLLLTKSVALSDIWNSEAYRQVRRQMLSGSLPKDCEHCQRHESGGLLSKRQKYNRQRPEWAGDFASLIAATDADGALHRPPRVFDLRLGNVCNLKCVMCRPELSSKWEGDYRSLRESQFVLPQSVQEHLSWTLDDNEGNNDWFADGKVIDFFRGNLGHVRQLYFSGGESLLSSSHRELVNLCIESGYAKNIELIYDTNGLGISEEWLKIWSQFGGIDIHISIDGLGEKYEYIRFPGKFVEFEKAARALAEWEFSGKKVRILVTLQALNILDQAEILDWYWTLFGRESQIRHSIVFGQVRWPECLSPRILPLEGRRRAFQKAEDYAHKLLASGVPKSELFPLGDLGRRMEFCFEDTQGGNKRVEDFLVYLGQLDQVRGTCWQKTFPELAGLIEEVGRG